MPAPLVKICGINTADALEAAIAARADYVGFVAFPKSPRHVDLKRAAELGAQARGRIGRVGLFVDADAKAIGAMVEAAGLDAIQLHGEESPATASKIRARFGLPVWKAVSVSTAADVAGARRYVDAADLVLFDAKTPEGTLPGGMGLVFDWSLIADYRGPLAWGLAGGLTPDNVAEAVRLTGAPLVDTSSGVESAPGVKDAARIAAFCAAARDN